MEDESQKKPQHSSDPEEAIRKHQLFLNALDKVPKGMPESEWIEHLSKKLEWEYRDVEKHAYVYFTALVQHDQKQRRQATQPESPSDWSPEESTLFDALFAVFAEAQPEKQPKWSVVTHVAAYFPQRTPNDVWERWMELREN